MNAGTLMELLMQVEAGRLVVGFEPGMGGLTELTVAYRDQVAGLGFRSPTDKVDCLVLVNGNAKFMQSKGIDVVEASEDPGDIEDGEHIRYALDALVSDLDEWLKDPDPAEAYDKLLQVYREIKELA